MSPEDQAVSAELRAEWEALLPPDLEIAGMWLCDGSCGEDDAVAHAVIVERPGALPRPHGAKRRGRGKRRR